MHWRCSGFALGLIFSESKARSGLLGVDDVSKEQELLGERFSRPKLVPRNKSYHYAEAVGAGRIALRLTSVSSKKDFHVAED